MLPADVTVGLDSSASAHSSVLDGSHYSMWNREPCPQHSAYFCVIGWPAFPEEANSGQQGPLTASLRQSKSEGGVHSHLKAPGWKWDFGAALLVPRLWPDWLSRRCQVGDGAAESDPGKGWWGVDRQDLISSTAHQTLQQGGSHCCRRSLSLAVVFTALVCTVSLIYLLVFLFCFFALSTAHSLECMFRCAYKKKNMLWILFLCIINTAL